MFCCRLHAPAEQMCAETNVFHLFRMLSSTILFLRNKRIWNKQSLPVDTSANIYDDLSIQIQRILNYPPRSGRFRIVYSHANAQIVPKMQTQLSHI